MLGPGWGAWHPQPASLQASESHVCARWGCVYVCWVCVRVCWACVYVCWGVCMCVLGLCVRVCWCVWGACVRVCWVCVCVCVLGVLRGALTELWRGVGSQAHI